MNSAPSTNWSKTFPYSFRNVLFPASIDELRSAVAASPNIKVLGSRHSFNAIADGEAALILGGIPIEPVLDPSRKKVTIAGHATYGDLAVFLSQHGLAVHNLASLPHISIAGAIATATHGSGRRNGNLATAVSGLEIVTADGSIVTTTRGDADFEGMVVHLGALGVISRVTLDVEPEFDVAQHIYEGLSWDVFFAHLASIMDEGYSVSIFTRWGDEAGQIWVKRREGLDKSASKALHGAPLATVKRHPISGIDPVNSTDQLGLLGPWFERLPHFKMGFTPSNGDEIQSEFHIPLESASAAIEAVFAIRDRFAHLIQVTEFRAVAADTLWLSPQYKRDTLSMHFTWVADTEAVDVGVKHIEDALQPFNALPHWGKVFSATHVGDRYPMLSRFMAIRDRLDPDGKFTNTWLKTVVFGRDSGQ